MEASPLGEFESSVILEGTKTERHGCKSLFLFESSVILEGTKTFDKWLYTSLAFESSVILEGTKTYILKYITKSFVWE